MKITIQATIFVNIKKVWECYTEPQHIVHWNFASEDWCCPSAENDLRVGGKYSARMEAKDKSFGFDFEGLYKEIILEKRLVYALNEERQVDVSFEDNKDNTIVTVIFHAENKNPVEMQKNGWQAILNNFKMYVEENC